MSAVFTLRRLGIADAEAYRELRLEGLRDHPEAFGASWDDEGTKPLAWFAGRLESHAVFGGFLGGARLAGVAGLRRMDGVKTRHKGVLWGMFVRPEARGTGLAAALVSRVIEQAEDLEELQLSVVATNPAAVRLYTNAGFREYGLERRSLRVGERYFDEILMALRLTRP